jgi:peptidoglycan/xylan/chitin deacetylase (PgdA/CDA1 family)
MRRNSVIAAVLAVMVLMLSACRDTETPAPSAHPTAQPAKTTPTEQPWTMKDVEAAIAKGYTTSRCGNLTSTKAHPKGRIVLSFDDWAYGDPYRAVRIGAYLQEHHIRALFFVVWDFAQKYPDIVRTLREQGHWVLNHTYSHPFLTHLTNAAVRSQIRRGTPHTNMLRPPFGAYNKRVKDIATSMGKLTCTWTIDSNDTNMIGGHYRSATSIRKIVREAPVADKHAGMVLGHLFSNYLKAVPGIIDDFTADGYPFCRNTGPVGAQVPFPLAC